jgi:GLPGLI family protein
MIRAFILLILFSNLSQSQITLVKYSHERHFTEDQLTDPVRNRGVRNTLLLENIKTIKPNLIFDNEKSIFTFVKLDDINMKFAYSSCSCIVDIFQIGNKKYYYNRDNFFPKEKFIIEEKIVDWTITDEQKIIEGFNCYKAIAKRVEKNNENEYISHIEAWFAPDIPCNFGPANYGNLPGLILYVKEGNYVFYAYEIIYNYSEKVNYNLKGETITLENYLLKLDELLKNMK